MATEMSALPKCEPRVLIADDDEDARAMLSDLLAHEGYTPVVAADGEKALALAVRHPLELALVDVVMPGPSGIVLADRLKDLQPSLEVIIITAYGSEELATEAMYRGAFYYLPKPLDLMQVMAVVKEAWAVKQARERVLSDLTDRELEVLSLLAEGKTNAEIAEALCISVRTASTHVCNILSKLGVQNRVQAAVLWDRYAQRRQRR